MSYRLFIVGAGGFGREVHEYARDAGRARDGSALTVVGFLDDNLDALAGHDVGASVVARIDDVVPATDDRFLLAVGSPNLRRRIAERLAARGARFVTIIHPTAWVAREATIGQGTIVGPLSYVGPGACLGEHVLVNPQVAVAHDVAASSYVVFSPLSAANGAVVLEEGAFLGTHAIVLPGCRVGAWSYVGAGALVRHDVAPGARVVGVPARSLGPTE